MRGEWRVDPARPAEAGEVARLARGSIVPRLRRLTLWASPRAARYVEALLSGAFVEAPEFFLLRRAGRPAGLAAFRTLHGQAFLNHLSVEPRLRGRSLGTWLLAEAAARYLDRHNLTQVALDVFADRSTRGPGTVERWYARLGFLERDRRSWWLAPPAAGRGKPLCEGWTEAGRQHRAWGFSSFLVYTPAGRRYRVGRLYAPLFRLTGPEAAEDLQLWAALGSLDPRRSLLLIAPEVGPGRGCLLIAQSRRLECAARALLENLKQRLGNGA